MPVKRVVPTPVDYSNTATFKPRGIDPDDVAEGTSKVKKLTDENPDLVAVTPKESRTFRYAGKWYELERGIPAAVEPDVADMLRQTEVVD